MTDHASHHQRRLRAAEEEEIYRYKRNRLHNGASGSLLAHRARPTAGRPAVSVKHKMLKWLKTEKITEPLYDYVSTVQIFNRNVFGEVYSRGIFARRYFRRSGAWHADAHQTAQDELLQNDSLTPIIIIRFGTTLMPPSAPMALLLTPLPPAPARVSTTVLPSLYSSSPLQTGPVLKLSIAPDSSTLSQTAHATMPDMRLVDEEEKKKRHKNGLL